MCIHMTNYVTLLFSLNTFAFTKHHTFAADAHANEKSRQKYWKKWIMWEWVKWLNWISLAGHLIHGSFTKTFLRNWLLFAQHVTDKQFFFCRKYAFFFKLTSILASDLNCVYHEACTRIESYDVNLFFSFQIGIANVRILIYRVFSATLIRAHIHNWFGGSVREISLQFVCYIHLMIYNFVCFLRYILFSFFRVTAVTWSTLNYYSVLFTIAFDGHLIIIISDNTKLSRTQELPIPPFSLTLSIFLSLNRFILPFLRFKWR